jgi:hypothetical protein
MEIAASTIIPVLDLHYGWCGWCGDIVVDADMHDWPHTPDEWRAFSDKADAIRLANK